MSSNDFSHDGVFQVVRAIADDMLRSSEEVLAAAQLVGDDDVKSAMIQHLAGDFDAITAREQALTLLITRREYDSDFVIEEMASIARMNRALASRIREKLAPLAQQLS